MGTATRTGAVTPVTPVETIIIQLSNQRRQHPYQHHPRTEPVITWETTGVRLDPTKFTWTHLLQLMIMHSFQLRLTMKAPTIVHISQAVLTPNDMPPGESKRQKK